MNDIEIRVLYRDLTEPAPDLETANRQRKLAAEAISTLFQKAESLREENQRIAGEVVKIRRMDGVRDLSVTYTMTYADAATHKLVADLACTVLCGLMEEDLKRRDAELVEADKVGAVRCTDFARGVADR